MMLARYASTIIMLAYYAYYCAIILQIAHGLQDN